MTQLVPARLSLRHSRSTRLRRLQDRVGRPW